jgi:hypothetical protein
MKQSVPTRLFVPMAIPRPPLPLLLVTALVLGCVVGLECAQWLIETRQAISLSILSQAEYANILDHLLPYRLAAFLLLLLAGLATVVVELCSMTRRICR